MKLFLCMFLLLLSTMASAFVTPGTMGRISSARNGAESEVTFDADKLDGSEMRIGIIKTRWNSNHVDKLVAGIRKGLKECKVADENIFETSVPGAFELPLAARFLALSGTVDAIITTGVLIKGDTMHFEYIADAASSAIMSVGLQTSTPVIFGVLTCLNEQQVIARSDDTKGHNHGVDWGKTAVEMALLRTEALGGKASDSGKLADMGFGSKPAATETKKAGAAFF